MSQVPPKAKITRQMILQTVLELTRETGFGSVNARSIAGRLRCSTRPIFTCYQNMEELKNEFLTFAYGYYERYVSRYGGGEPVPPCLVLPLSYIQFAQEEPHLFKLLFISDMALDMTEAKDFYREPGNLEKARRFSELTGVEAERAKAIFLDLFLYSHGIAVLTATEKLLFDRKTAEKLTADLLRALIRQADPGWDLPA